MRPTFFPILAASAVLALLLTPTPDLGQPPPGGQPKPSQPQPPDEFKALLNEVTEAYKAPHEVDKDILDELRKQYRDPTPQREMKIFREIRRLYHTTPQQEEAILREIRAAYATPSPEQEDRIFREIRRGGTLPLGTVPMEVQFNQAKKLFARFDQNGDGVLAPDEMPDALLSEWRRFDRNRDGVIDFNEYGAYYQAHLGWVSEKVASGEIPLKLPKGMSGPTPATDPAGQPVALRPDKLPTGLPAWFEQLDTDHDGQIGLYEWRAAGRPTAEFVAMDLDGDGLLTPDEYRRFVLLNPPDKSAMATTGKPDPKAKPTSKGLPPGPGK